MFTDENFVRANGIKIISGRDFRQMDSGKGLINETLARKLGLTPETAPGTRLYPQQDPGEQLTYVEVAGVMKDFNFSSLHDDIKSFMLRYEDLREMANVIVNTSSKNYKTFLGKIHSIWRFHFPSVPFEYSFVDEIVQQQYETEVTLSHIIDLFTLMAIFISCLGLFGLAAFSAEQRTKEIGIRKVLGASISSIVSLLSKNFLKLAAVAIFIAIPIAWLTMNRWLEGFAYRIHTTWWMFALAGGLTILIVLITVSFQAIKTACVNPAKSLKME